MAKDKVQRRIDFALPSNAGNAVVETTSSPAPPALPTIPAPTGLALTTALARSAVTPTALISATWDIPHSVEPQRYAVQWSTDSGFPEGSTSGMDAPQTSATIDGLKPDTLYYVRVAALYRAVQSPWSDAESITTDDDTTPPDPVTSAAGDFTTGDLVLTCTNPTSLNLKDVRIRIYASMGGALLREIYTTTGRFVWTAAMNYLDTGGAPDPSVYVVLTARSYNNVTSTDVTLSATKSAPSLTGTFATSWDSDAGTEGADLVFTWGAVANIQDYILTLDGVTHILVDNRFVYTFSQNTQEHSGTADYAISYSLVARDRLLQSSTALTGTTTNAVPITPSSASVVTYSSGIAVAIGASTVADLDYWLVTLYLSGVAQATVKTKTLTAIMTAAASGSYTVGVKGYDLFGRVGSERVSSSFTMDVLTTSELRSGVKYTDSDGNSAATLAVLKDGTKANPLGADISYAGSASWRWAIAERPTLDRYHQVTVIAGSGIGYIGVSADGVTYSYYSGPLDADGRTLTAVANETAAKAAAISLPIVGTGRWDLPDISEIRFVKLGFKMTGPGNLYEFYPRRFIQTDDLDAEIIRGMTVVAGELVVNQLSALAADLGTITAGTVTGATVQTATSGARTVLSSAANGGIVGYGASDTYNPATGSGTYQILWKKTDGKFYAGGGNVIIESNGIFITAPTSGGFAYDAQRAINWKSSSGATVAVIQAFTNVPSGGTTNGIELHAYQNASIEAKLNLVAEGSGYTSALYLNGTAANGDIHTQGYFGVNTIPVYPLDVSGNGRITGNLGIGMAPTLPLDVTGSNIRLTGSSSPYYVLNTTHASNKRTGVVFQQSTTSLIEIGLDSAGNNTRDFYIYDNIASAFRLIITTAGAFNVATGPIQIAGTQVTTSRRTGWGAPTGTPTRTTFATSTVTLVQLAERVKALIDDLTTHGLIGA